MHQYLSSHLDGQHGRMAQSIPITSTSITSPTSRCHASWVSLSVIFEDTMTYFLENSMPFSLSNQSLSLLFLQKSNHYAMFSKSFPRINSIRVTWERAEDGNLSFQSRPTESEMLGVQPSEILIPIYVFKSTVLGPEKSSFSCFEEFAIKRVADLSCHSKISSPTVSLPSIVKSITPAFFSTQEFSN